MPWQKESGVSLMRNWKKEKKATGSADKQDRAHLTLASNRERKPWIHVHLPGNLFDKLKQLAIERNCTYEKVVLEAVEEYLGRTKIGNQ